MKLRTLLINALFTDEQTILNLYALYVTFHILKPC